MRERFPKMGLYIHVIFSLTLNATKCSLCSKFFLVLSFIYLFIFVSSAVNHLDYLGVQVAWVTGPWFLTIFMNMLPWESGQVLCCIFLIIFFSGEFVHLNISNLHVV